MKMTGFGLRNYIKQNINAGFMRLKMEIRIAQMSDLNFLENYDKHITKNILIKQIKESHILIANEESESIGWLRYNLFWDCIPFMNLLHILQKHRGKGYGKILTLEWEKAMKDQGYCVVMTSTQANEASQHFYRKLGYVDVGGFMPPHEPFEIILMKQI